MTEGLLFSTSGSEHLVEPVLQKASLRPALYRLGNFVDGEIMFYLDEPVKDKACFVLGHTSALAENLLRLLTIINTLRIHGAKPITAVIPYFGYGRSDKAKPGQPVNARLFAGFLKQAGADKVICLDLHSQLVEDYLTMPVTHLSAIPLMAEELQPTLTSDFGVASPDKGGVNRAKEFARNLGIKHIIEITKSRLRQPSRNTHGFRRCPG